jgi:hypothetical protein
MLSWNQGLPRPGAKGAVVTLAGRTEPIPSGWDGFRNPKAGGVAQSAERVREQHETVVRNHSPATKQGRRPAVTQRSPYSTAIATKASKPKVVEQQPDGGEEAGHYLAMEGANPDAPRDSSSHGQRRAMTTITMRQTNGAFLVTGKNIEARDVRLTSRG